MTHETIGALGALLLIGGACGAVICFMLGGIFEGAGISPRIWLAGAVTSIALVVLAFADLLYTSTVSNT